MAKHCPQHSDNASVGHRKGQRFRGWEVVRLGIETDCFATVSTCSIFLSYVIPATVAKEKEAFKWMNHEDYNLNVRMLCNYHQGSESLINLSIQWGFVCVQNFMRCGERRQEKCMMPSLPLRNLCGDQTNTKNLYRTIQLWTVWHWLEWQF